MRRVVVVAWRGVRAGGRRGCVVTRSRRAHGRGRTRVATGALSVRSVHAARAAPTLSSMPTKGRARGQGREGSLRLVVARLVRDPIRAQRARGGAAAEPEGANTWPPPAPRTDRTGHCCRLTCRRDLSHSAFLLYPASHPLYVVTKRRAALSACADVRECCPLDVTHAPAAGARRRCGWRYDPGDGDERCGTDGRG
jgi:hypothetical protein